MSPKPRPTFNKLQKERARQQKQRDKIERKQQRKLDKIAGVPPSDENETLPLSEHDLPNDTHPTDSNETI